jgi:hypothetical protein
MQHGEDAISWDQLIVKLRYLSITTQQKGQVRRSGEGLGKNRCHGDMQYGCTHMVGPKGRRQAQSTSAKPTCDLAQDPQAA